MGQTVLASYVLGSGRLHVPAFLCIVMRSLQGLTLEAVLAILNSAPLLQRARSEKDDNDKERQHCCLWGRFQS